MSLQPRWDIFHGASETTADRWHRREYHIVVLGAGMLFTAMLWYCKGLMFGIGGVGKSCLTAQFVQNIWIESYDPTIEDSSRKQMEVDVRIPLSLVRMQAYICLTSRGVNASSKCKEHPLLSSPSDPARPNANRLDTAGTEQFKAMRELYMKQGQGFLLVFSITSMSSLHELAELREQIIRIKDDPNVPLVIVGNKSDLEEDRVVSRQRAYELSQRWGNAPYYETSARRRANVDEVFVDLCRQIIRKDMYLTQMRDQELETRRRERPNRHDRKRSRRHRLRDRCVLL
jgi:Ras-related protein Rap-1B